VSEDNNVWDSNAENIWRRRSYSKGFFSPQSDKSSNPPPGWKQPRKEWDYDSKDKTSDSSWRWWQFAKDNDEYDYESGEEEDEEEEDNESDFDFKSVSKSLLYLFASSLSLPLCYHIHVILNSECWSVIWLHKDLLLQFGEENCA
jgi:hypothetical protein